jgi:hypothetical protein
MTRWRDPVLHGDRAAYAASLMSLALGLFFIFVWAPHPWGWLGFDHYHDIALEIADGRPFPTMEVPWGYAYFLAGFYRVFGIHPWIPLVAQAAINALLPLLVFGSAAQWVGRRTATLAAVLTGLFSFNTIYASTESSDALCTVIFMAAIFLFTRGLQRRRLAWLAAAGALAGIAPQFRPNLILLPLLLTAYGLWAEPTRRRLLETALVLACAAAAIAPWVARNYRMTGTVMPTSVHGGVQLWYGTLQVGPYLRSRAYNPRMIFEAPVFEYSSLDDVSIVVEADYNCTEQPLDSVSLAYWSDADPAERRVPPARVDAHHFTFLIPEPGREVVLHYYFIATWSGPSGPLVRTTPSPGARAPFVYFVNQNHLGDMDVHGDLLDVFDVVRLVRHEAWGEGLPYADRLGAVDATDARRAAAILLRPLLEAKADTAVSSLTSDGTSARLTFADGSTITVPRIWQDRITDLSVTDGMASTLMTSRRSFRSLEAAPPRPTGLDLCLQSVEVAVNQVFYRREPHMMRRYMALSYDNIRRHPLGFLLAAGYRAVRVFIVEGASDRVTAQQFTHSGRIYAAGEVVSIALLVLCAAGIVVGWRRGNDIGLPLLLIVSVPATLAPVLINMRYTVTIQPLMFVFIATALTWRRSADLPQDHR